MNGKLRVAFLSAVLAAGLSGCTTNSSPQTYRFQSGLEVQMGDFASSTSTSEASYDSRERPALTLFAANSE